MAYMNQEKKAAIAAALKKVVPAGWKYSLSVRHHSTIVMTILSAPVDLIAEANESNRKLAEMRGDEPHIIKGYYDVNPYHHRADDTPSGEVLAKIIEALNLDNFDKSDWMTDYHHVGHYVDLKVGRWDKPFQLTTETKMAA